MAGKTEKNLVCLDFTQGKEEMRILLFHLKFAMA